MFRKLPIYLLLASIGLRCVPAVAQQQIQPTPYTRDLLRSASAAEARQKLGVPDELIAPEDWTMILLPDTQYYSQNFPATFTNQTVWISNNVAAFNIKAVAHLGDVVQTGNNATEWDRAMGAMSWIAGVPHVIAVGNHDYDTIATRVTTTWNARVGTNYFSAKPWWDGGFHPAGSSENHYLRFSVNNEQWLIISLEFGARATTLDWANSVVEGHPNHRVIVVTHTHVFRNSRLDDRATPAAASRYGISEANVGDQVWHQFLKLHPNIEFVFGAHHVPLPGAPGFGATGSIAMVGENGNVVRQFLNNYQDEADGGTGYLRILTFQPRRARVLVQTYSPLLDEWRLEPENNFRIDMVVPTSDRAGLATQNLLVRGNAELRGAVSSELAYDGFNDGLILHLPWTPTTDGTVTDRSLAGHHAYLQRFPAAAVSFGAGVIGTGGEYSDTLTEDVLITTNAFNALAAVTVSVWFRGTNLYAHSGSPTLIQKGGAFELRVAGTPERISWLTGAALDNVVTGTNSLPMDDGQWHHVAGTWDGSTSRIYLDGVLAHSASQAGPLPGSTSSTRVGSRGGGGVFSGSLDEIRVWSRALSSQEVAALYSLHRQPITVRNQILASHGTGVIGLGHGIRSANRAELHLHSNGDVPVDLMFGRGPRQDDNVRWSISLRGSGENDSMRLMGPGFGSVMHWNTNGNVSIGDGSAVTAHYRLDISGGDLRLRGANRLRFGGSGAGDAEWSLHRTASGVATATGETILDGNATIVSNVTVGGTVSSEAAHDPLDDGLRLYLPFSEGSGTVARDRSRYAHTGTLIDSPVWTRDGLLGRALTFGTNQVHVASSVVSTAQAEYTASVWFNWGGGGGGSDGRRFMLETTGTSNPFAISLALSAGSTPVLTTTIRAGAANFSVSGTTVITAGRWYLATIRYIENDSVQIFLDGKSEGSVVPSGGLPATTGLRIGTFRDANNRWFHGMLDEVRIWDRALSDDHIRGFYRRDAHTVTELTVGGVRWIVGAGSPEGAVTAPVGSVFSRTDGGASTTLYVKESGTGNTGWAAK